jgi:hypothetical protein
MCLNAAAGVGAGVYKSLGGGKGGGSSAFPGQQRGRSFRRDYRTHSVPPTVPPAFATSSLFLVASAGCYILTTSLAPFPPVRSVLLSCFLIFFRESRGLFYFCFVGGVLRVGGTGGGMHLLCRWDVRVGFLGGSKLGVKLCQKIK